MRRGMPSIPGTCMASNVRLKPMTNSQKCQRASRSLSIRPVTFGIPVVDAAEDAEEHAADQHPVEVGDDEVGVGELPVERRGASMMPVSPAIRN